MTNRWAPIPGYSGFYTISDGGQVRSIRAQKMLSPVLDGHGYQTVRLSLNGNSTRYFIHRLVAAVFLPAPSPLHKHVAHLDGDKLNNSSDNLKWVSPPENAFHKRQHGTHQAGEKHPRAKLTLAQVVEIRASTLSNSALGRAYGVRDAAISKIRKGQRWKTPDA